MLCYASIVYPEKAEIPTSTAMSGLEMDGTEKGSRSTSLSKFSNAKVAADACASCEG